MSQPKPDIGLDALFTPRSIAVVGASNKAGKMGNLFIRRLAAEYRGSLFAINPNEAEVAGVETRRSITEIPGPIDVLIALVPAASLVELVEVCLPGQIRYLLAIPSGFGEISGDGRDIQEQLRIAAQERGIRIVGPNIVGIMNGARGINASMMPELPPGGRGLSCITQSGGFGMALSMYALDHDLRFAKFCDLGNMCDLGVAEVLEYLADDDDTEVVGLFLESAGEEKAFRAAIERAALRKPVVVAPIGMSKAGRRASLAHLGIAHGIEEMGDRWPADAVIVETALDLLHASKALLWQPRANGNRVAILTGTGGIGAELSDLVTRQGLEISEFSIHLQSRIRRYLPYFAGCSNPVDVTPIWWDYPSIYPRVLSEIAASGEVDALIISVTDVAASIPELAKALSNWAKSKRTIPAVVYWGARDRDRENMRLIEAEKLPCYRSTREAVSAVAAVVLHKKRANDTPVDESAIRCGRNM